MINLKNLRAEADDTYHVAACDTLEDIETKQDKLKRLLLKVKNNTRDSTGFKEKLSMAETSQKNWLDQVHQEVVQRLQIQIQYIESLIIIRYSIRNRAPFPTPTIEIEDRKSTRLNSSH